MKIPRIESLVLIICFLAVVVWAVQKCNAKRATIKPAITQKEERPVKRDTVFVREGIETGAAPVTTTAPVTAPAQPYKLPANPGEAVQTATQERTVTTQVQPQQAVAGTKPATQTVVKNQTTLFVTIDQLKLRREPGLKSETIAQLDLYEQVYFMNEKSDYTQEINLGTELVTDYWVKVKTKSGKVGWVFGAGVHYYKQKRKGTLE